MCCDKCKQNKPIVNKRYNLCDDCNFMRLHDGKTKTEIYLQRASIKPLKPVVNRFNKVCGVRKSQKRINQQTPKQVERAQQLSLLKSEIEIDAKQDGNYYCWGCGNGGVSLDKSHILSVKHRKDLELERLNINLFCRNCHIDWESGDIIKMLKLNTFEKDLQYIKQKDASRYNKLFDAIHYLLIHEEVFSEYSKELEKADKIFQNNDFLTL